MTVFAKSKYLLSSRLQKINNSIKCLYIVSPKYYFNNHSIGGGGVVKARRPVDHPGQGDHVLPGNTHQLHLPHEV